MENTGFGGVFLCFVFCLRSDKIEQFNTYLAHLMTYLAPRQGLFAIIILFGIALHLAFFVISQEHRLTEQYQRILDREVVSLAEELSTSMSNKDQVSMSVMASNYVKNDSIDAVAIFDSKDKSLVSVGQKANQGVAAHSMITLDNKVLGSVQLYAPKISRAQIISDNWLFLAATLVLYVLIFFIYGYVARPSKEMQQQMAKDIRDELLALGMLSPQKTEAEPVIQPNSQTQVAQPDNMFNPVPPKSLVNEDIDKLRVVKICFEDNNKLLETIDYHTKSTYFALCNQLLDRAVYSLLGLSLFAGVSVFDIEYYDNQKALVILKADNPDAKVALAAVMLAKLMMMLNQIVYNKHRELKRFCLQIRTLVSKVDKQDAVADVAKKHRESPLILVSATDLAQIGIYGELGRLSELTTVDERESRYLSGVSPAMGERLISVRDMVLLSGEPVAG